MPSAVGAAALHPSRVCGDSQSPGNSAPDVWNHQHRAPPALTDSSAAQRQGKGGHSGISGLSHGDQWLTPCFGAV